MTNPEVSKKLNEQVSAEFFASITYLQMCAWCDTKGLEGASKFFKAHSLEEREHMDKVFNYMTESNLCVTLGATPAPRVAFDNLMEVLDAAFAHEKKVTEKVNQLAELAFAHKDYTTFNFMQWFIAEQHQEEVLFQRILDKATMLGFSGENGQALWHIDNYLGRVASGQ